GPEDGVLLDQLQLAPTILRRLGVPVPPSMKARAFLE
ncbi:alkaline phosphatase family protein, partial [Rhizobiaceae sp. 2RAB30]